MQYQCLIYEKDADIARITLNTPKSLNALGLTMVKELLEVLEDAGKDSAIKVIVLAGTGKAFSAGGDVALMEQGLSANDARAWIDDIGKVILGIASMEKLVIASVSGIAYGAGCNLALACDFIAASEESKFCEVFANIGLVPDGGGTYLLPRLIGLARARELLFTARAITAQEAKDIGMIQYVVPGNELADFVRELAQKLAKTSSPATGITKKLLFQGFVQDFGQALDKEAVFQSLCMETEEHKKRIKDFFDKKKKN
ncbi:MAG: enoyl-CoA hydratase/isomerase family protein [Clostridia bacterium]|jgi:2-(1,2-epoxy-1,2-dihydrophenyl)acetyl-CoA isomerase|nr:enoyl-CoA hydratase/isomerase family protein [Clostridia bacterium]